MAKFDIRKATGRSKENQTGYKQNDDFNTSGTVQIPSDKMKNTTVSVDDDFFKTVSLFDTIVTHNYLADLSDYPIIALNSVASSGMGWYRITKIVYDRSTFFPDQLSMLYTALHNVARNVALVIDKKGFDDIEIYIGARDFEGNLHEASTLLASAIQGFLPGIKIDVAVGKEFCKNNESVYVASYSGVASLRDDKKDSFVQGIEKFIDSTPSIPTYTALFIADNISQKQANDMVRAYVSLQDVINPLTQCQESINESSTEGLSKTLTKTLGETITDTLSETVTRTEGTNHSYAKSHSTSSTNTVNNSHNCFKTAWNGIFGGETGYSSGITSSTQTSEQSGSHVDFSKANGSSQSKAKMDQQSQTQGTNTSKTTGSTRQITRTNSSAKAYVDLLERHTERLRNGIPFGLWSVGTYFVSPDIYTSHKLANIYRGCITGEESDIDSTAVNIWDKVKSKLLIKYLQDTQNPRFLVDKINVSGGVVETSKELAIHLSLPQTSVPGVELRECATFGRNINSRKSSQNKELNCIHLGVISHLGNASKKEVHLDMEELNKHVFVTGSTGSGKSNTVYLLIDELMNRGKHVLIVEPTKGDYRKVFGGIKGITVFSTRENEKNLLKINPFAFPEGIQVVEHVERLVEVFGVCWPMYAAMPAVLKNSILSAYKACGWDLRMSSCKYGKLFPTIADVVIQLKRIIASSEYSADTKGDYIGALQTRLESLQNGIYASILSSSDNIPYDVLYDNNAIIDLHHIGSTETRSLLMALVVLGLNEWRMSQGEDDMDSQLQHVTVLEEAHNILPRVSKQQNQEGSNMLGKSVEMIASAMAEMRTYGESFIIVDQSPSAVDEAAIRNTNTKIVMNLPDGEDREIAGKSMGLVKEEQIAELAHLSTGEAIVWQRGWTEAVMAAIDEMKVRLPLFAKDNKATVEGNANIQLSELFIDFFINGKRNLSIIEREELESEILHATCPSIVKASLLDAVNSEKVNSIKTMRESLIVYLGLQEQMVRLLDIYIEGSIDLIKEMRQFMASHLNIENQNVQNELLSLSFIWASYQSKKWHSICRLSMPSNYSILKAK